MNDDTMLFAFLDGELDDAQQVVFEERVRTDAALADRLEKMHAIEGGLLRIAEQDTPRPIRLEEHRKGRGVSLKWVGYAAAMVVCASLFVMMNRQAARMEFDGGQLYAKLTPELEPAYVCSNAEEFAEYTEIAYGEAIHADFGGSVELVGWAYRGGGSYDPKKPSRYPVTRILMARVQTGEPILVVLVDGDLAKPVIEDSGVGLRVFRKKIRDVELYEITPLDEARVLGLISK